jgi:hypothetical protein
LAAWVVWVIALVAMLRQNPSANPDAGGVLLAALVLVATGILMLVMLVGALVKLVTLGKWGWFVAVLVSHVFFLGIAGMVAYALAGPADEEVVIRPAVV